VTGQSQDALYASAGAENAVLLLAQWIALAEARGINQNQRKAAQAGHRLCEAALLIHNPYRYIQDAAKRAQLVMRPYPVGIGGDQCDLAQPMLQHIARCELGNGGGLADTGWTDKGKQ